MNGLLGTSMDDPRTMAVLQGVAGLLGARGGLQGITQGLLGYQGAMQQAKQQAAQDEERAMRRKMAELQLQQAQAEAARTKRVDDWRASIPNPWEQATAQALGGGGGPTPANAAAMPQVSPMLQQMHAGMRAGAIDPMDYIKATQPQKAKIKEYQQVRMPDGSVQIVGLDEYGNPVKTGQTPFKPEEVRDAGGYIIGIDPITGLPRKVADKTQSPDSKASNALGWANFNLSRQRLDFEKNQPRGQYDPERGLLVDTRTGTASPVTVGGQPLGAKAKDMTEGQAKALLFGARAQEANKALEDLAQAGVYRPGNIYSAASSTPLVGQQLGALTNWTQSADQQRVEQAKRDFINAILRRESGAVIGKEEFESGDKQYFPQIGDDKATIEQKARNRELAIRGILAEVPASHLQRVTQNQGGVEEALQRALRANGPRKPGTGPLTRDQLDAAFNAYGGF